MAKVLWYGKQSSAPPSIYHDTLSNINKLWQIVMFENKGRNHFWFFIYEVIMDEGFVSGGSR
jgi:hypothetical protein